ncbi:MAG: ribonuclease P protein component [Pseudomonadota bacterium]|nr:ribonuclease P protein component [Pseudomonadota bacterium]
MTATQKEQKKDSQLKKIEKITKRSDYIRAANSIFKKSSSLVVQFYNRGDTSGPRYGITASKKIGNAIKRNKAKRRIRHLIKNLLPKYGKNGYDYVFVAKDKVIESPWDSLLQETETILKDFKYE